MWCGSCYQKPPYNLFHHAQPSDESGVHWRSDKDKDRHLYARDGDHLITPLQCDLCVFRNLKGRNPTTQDDFLMACIRQVNLDALWGRETATVGSTLRAVQQTIKALQQVHLTPPFPPLGPYSVKDSFGYAIAMAIIIKSRSARRYANYQQFESIRKLRAGFSNVFMASVLGNESLCTMGGNNKGKQFINNCPTNSPWFEQFARGCLSRMGQIVKQDRAVSLDLMHAFLGLVDQEWATANAKERADLAAIGAYATFAFCGSFRGLEVFLVDLHGLIKYTEERLKVEGKEFIIIPLLGRFKNELGDQYHLTPLIAETQSGIKVRVWAERLIEARQSERRTHGLAFGSADGTCKYGWFEREILERFQVVQQKHPDIIPADVQVLEDYGVSRSFRRGATSEARARGVKPADIDIANRWRSFKDARGHRPRLAMRDHYSDIRLVIPALLRFSENL
jgi:hypothetical protein